MCAMPEGGPNTAVARRLYDAFTTGDLEGVFAVLHPGVEWELVGPAEIPYFGRYRGAEEMRRFFEVLGATCQVEAFEVHQTTETARGAVVEGFERGTFVGRGSYEMRWCHVMEMEDGLIRRFTDHLDTAPMSDAWRR